MSADIIICCKSFRLILGQATSTSTRYTISLNKFIVKSSCYMSDLVACAAAAAREPLSRMFSQNNAAQKKTSNAAHYCLSPRLAASCTSLGSGHILCCPCAKSWTREAHA